MGWGEGGGGEDGEITAQTTRGRTNREEMGGQNKQVGREQTGYDTDEWGDERQVEGQGRGRRGRRGGTK